MTHTEGETFRTEPFAYRFTDFLALNRRVTGWWAIVPAIIAGAFIYVLLEPVISGAWPVDWLLLMIVALIIFAFAGPWTWIPWIRYVMMKRQGLIQQQVVALGETVLTIRSAAADSSIKWPAMLKIVRTKDRLFLFRSKSVAFIVPKRAFKTAEDFDDFATMAQQRWEQNHRL